MARWGGGTGDMREIHGVEERQGNDGLQVGSGFDTPTAADGENLCTQ